MLKEEGMGIREKRRVRKEGKEGRGEGEGLSEERGWRG